MLKFTHTSQSYPEKRSSEERRTDFQEIVRGFEPHAAQEQSSRCSQCGVPFCQSGCPLGNNIPDWLMMAGNGQLEEAYELSAATSTMPEICGRICPQDRLCEQACVIEKSGHGAVTIGAVEQYITDTAWQEGWVEPILPGPDQGRNVGIVGSGPAGLTAAEKLREAGYQVTIYERSDRPGGLLMYGIPSFKLEKEVVQRRIDRLVEAGVDIQCDTEIGQDMAFADARRAHDALLLATGSYAARKLTCEGRVEAAIPALEFLTRSNRNTLGDAADETGRLDAHGKRVVVIGGGDTAMDCVRTAIRQGATEVTCLYRRDRHSMPGSRREVGYAEEEGVRFNWLSAPAELIVQNGQPTGVRVQGMRLGEPDESGRRRPVPDAAANTEIAADMVISALGFSAEDLPALFGEPELQVHPDGRVMGGVLTHETSLDGVFVAGDLFRGPSLVVWAIRDGLEVARAMTAWLKTRKPALEAAQ